MPCHLLSSSPSLRPFVTSSSPFVISSVPPDRREGEEEDKWRKTERRRGKGRASCRSLVSSPLPFTYSSLSPVPFVPSSFGPSRPRSFLTSVARFLTSSGTTGRKNDGTEWRWKGTEDDRSVRRLRRRYAGSERYGNGMNGEWATRLVNHLQWPPSVSAILWPLLMIERLGSD